MLLKRNLLENLTIISSSGTIICVLLNYITDISLIPGIWFPLYILTVFIVSIILSFKCIQWLLRLNKPLKYDLESVQKEYPYLAFLKRFLPEPRKRKPHEWKEYDTNELSVISTVLEKKLVSSWYVPYVSQEIGFPFACKQMLDQMIGKAFKICNKIETKDVFVDMCTIIITHLKEYKKALKRQEKSPESPIESLYKTSHPISETNTKYTSADHCTNILRILIKELLPWELWDTPHSELLVRILSKKLDVYIDNTLADPAWLNDKLMTYLTGEEYIEIEKVDKAVIDENCKMDKNIKEPIVLPVVKNTDVAVELNGQEDIVKMESIVEEQALNNNPVLDIKSSPVLRQKRGRQGRSEVKIYDRIIEGSVKTWETDMDLQCISLGHDLLESLDGEITLSRLWGQEGEAESSPERQGGKSPQPLWFGEEDALETERENSVRHSPPDVEREWQSPPSAAPWGHSPPAGGRDRPSPPGGGRDRPSPPGVAPRGLSPPDGRGQSAAALARARIGGLQVCPPEACRGDEAAGMMEGLLDFGIAGLKKGLRFTGLSDDSQDKSPSHRDKSDRSSPETRHKVYTADLATYPLYQKEGDNGNGAVPQLVKQHRVTSQDSVPTAPAPIAVGYPIPPCESPEPQYEEAADLSSSIAKLRCLLRQRAEPPNRGEEIWWEGAEETRGRTHHHHSSRPVDTATLADEYDMSMERNASPNQTSNNMQRLDKLFQRTVTGVFNSLKTAVGGEEEVPPAPGPAPRADWSYVCEGAGAGAGAARLLAERRALRVDAALDSLHLPPAPRRAPPDADDIEEWGVAHLVAWSGACGAACAAAPARHVGARLATLLLADVAESLITCWLDEVTAWMRGQVFAAFAAGAAATPARPRRPLRLGDTVELLLKKAPVLLVLFGEDSVRSAASLAAASLSRRELNRDVTYRALDLLALHFKNAAGLRNPSFDNN